MAELFAPLLTRIRIPSDNDRVYKDECVFCFDSPVCGGLICCMLTLCLHVGKKVDAKGHYSKGHYSESLVFRVSVYLYIRPAVCIPVA